MSLVEAATNVVIGYGIAVATQVMVFPIFGIHITLAGDLTDPGIRLFFQDGARVGQKGRTCHRWWLKGQRPPGLCDQRFDWTYIFATVEPLPARNSPWSCRRCPPSP